MNSDLIHFIPRSQLKEVNLRTFFLCELQKANERLKTTPHPYCELDCPWLRFCQLMVIKVSRLGCILSDLIDSDLWLLINDK
jgi:hypothetical protein